MKKQITTFLFYILVTMSFSPVLMASEKVFLPDGSGTNCKMIDTMQIGVNFNNVNIEIKNAKSFVDQIIEDINNYATELDLQGLEPQNINYNVYCNTGKCSAQSLSSGYMMNGSVSFKLDNSDKVTALVEKLDEKGYTVNLNMSSYRQCQ